MGAAAPIIAGIGKFIGANAGTILGGTAAAASGVAALKAGKMPSAPKPTVMPSADDEALEAARRRRLSSEMQRSGRASTILGGSGDRRDTLG